MKVVIAPFLLITSVLIAEATPFSSSDLLPWNWSIFHSSTAAMATAHVVSKEKLQPAAATDKLEMDIFPAVNTSSNITTPNTTLPYQSIKLLEELLPEERSNRALIYDYDGYE